jgi:uncharacterized protein (DUF427 family)
MDRARFYLGKIVDSRGLEGAMKLPGPDHPISIARNANRVRVSFGGAVIANTTRALTLREAGYAPVHYIPRADVAMSRLKPTAHASYCPYKGDANYFSIVAGRKTAENAVWSYERPYPAMSEIKGYFAFYPNRVDAIEVSAAA